jgi:outer membrane lipoprotein SlyB
MFKKPLIIASTAALIATATFSTQAKAGDPIFGALVGGALGATIGHAVDGRHGAGVGAAIGAFAGAASAASYDGYYGPGYGRLRIRRSRIRPACRVQRTGARVRGPRIPLLRSRVSGRDDRVQLGPYYGHRHYGHARYYNTHRGYY